MSPLAFLLSFALAALGVGTLLAASALPGAALISRLPGLDRHERRLFSLVAGLAAVGFSLSLLALAGGFDRPRILLLLLGLQGAAALVLRRGRREASAPSSSEPVPRLSPWLTAPLGGLGVLALLLALYPPASFDDTLYHLPLARSLAIHGGLVFEPQLRFPLFPLFQEVLIAVLWVFGANPASGGLLAVAELLLLGGTIALWTRRRSGARPAAVGTALVLGSPLFVWLGSVAYVDLALALFVVAAFWALDLARAEAREALHPVGGNAGWLALAGGLAGTAAAVKYHGLFFAAVLALALAWGAWRARTRDAPRDETWRGLGAFATAALLAAAPWYLRNALVAGNPVFPFLGSVFGRSPWTMPAVTLDGPRGGTLAEPGWPGWGPGAAYLGGLGLDLLRSPWLLLRDAVAPRTVPPLSPFAALLVPLAAAWGLFRRETRWLAAVVLGYLVLWLGSVQDARYLAPAVALAAGLVAALAGGLLRERESPRRRWVAALLVATLLAPAAGFVALRIARRGPPPLAAAARERYLARWLPGYALLACAGRELGPATTVYGIGTEQLQLHARLRLRGDWNGPYRFDLVAPWLDDPARLATALRGLEAGFLLVPAGRVTGPAPATGPAPLRLLATEQGFELWQVVPAAGDPADGSPPPRLVCPPPV